jgi:hypothetical protein
MQRRIVDPEDQKSLARWRLAVIGVYGTIIAALMIAASFNAIGNYDTLKAQMAPAKADSPTNALPLVSAQR